MKKIFTILLAASMMLVGAKASAQVAVGAGYLGANQKLSIKNLDISKSVYANGLYAGIEDLVQLDENLGLSFGAYYAFYSASASKAFSVLESFEDYAKGRLEEHFINVPFNIVFGTDVNENLRAFLYAGPTFSFGLSSKIKANILGDLLKFSACNNYKKDFLNRFDILFGAGLGFEVNDLVRIKVGYDYGLLNRIGDNLTVKDKQGNVTFATNEKASLNRSQITVGAAFMF